MEKLSFSVVEMDLNVVSIYFEATPSEPWLLEMRPERQREAGSLAGAQQADVTKQVVRECAEKS